MGSSSKFSSSESDEESGLVERKSAGLASEGSADAKMPLPYVPGLPVSGGRSLVGRSAAFRMVGFAFCISAIVMEFAQENLGSGGALQ